MGRHVDTIVVGAGFAGCVIAERLARIDGQQVLLIDKRDVLGGNADDYFNRDGVLVHKYGPHIFHTNSTVVWTYLSQFTRWTRYEHRVKAWANEKLLPFPINLDTINGLYGWDLNSVGMAEYLSRVRHTFPRVETAEQACLSRVGRDLYDLFFKGYTEKQWGQPASSLDAQITNRIPIRLDREDRYFTDRYQGIPWPSYHRLFTEMVDHPNIHPWLGLEVKNMADIMNVEKARVVWTGPLDQFFQQDLGPLPYRSLRFDHRTLRSRERLFPCGTINSPQSHVPYTRQTEFRWITDEPGPVTTIATEYPQATGDPYYPIMTPESRALAAQYLARAEGQGVTMAGRLGTYRYYNMDQVIAQALTLWRRLRT